MHYHKINLPILDTMKNQIISLTTAKLAKEKGFNNPEYLYYHSDGGDAKLSARVIDHNEFVPRYSAPDQSLLQKWLREEHELLISVMPFSMDIFNDHEADDTWCATIHAEMGTLIAAYYDYESYESALEAGLSYALELINP